MGFDSKLDRILRQAAEVFCARGYDRATIRDISRATGVSLAGLYYYFSSKGQLLYLIQRHAFETILAQARAVTASLRDPEERLQTLIALHLKYFIEHPNEMKVLTHEEAALGAEWRHELHALKKNYYRLCHHVVDEIRQERKLKGLNVRVAVLSLFGMMNWIYTWYNSRIDPDAAGMAREMSAMFFVGIRGRRFVRRETNGASRGSGRANGSESQARSPGLRGGNGSARRNAPRMRV
jgi:TetR/AcrR family transcriptional regulator, cholesterol catabolism regulator